MTTSSITLGGRQIVTIEQNKLCGGDIHRAKAPLPIIQGELPLSDHPEAIKSRERRRELKRTPIRESRFYVEWTAEIVAEVQIMRKNGISFNRIAKKLNELHPQYHNVKFTRCGVIGKMNRLAKA